jgi:hypothetical protein
MHFVSPLFSLNTCSASRQEYEPFEISSRQSEDSAEEKKETALQNIEEEKKISSSLAVKKGQCTIILFSQGP